MATVTGKTSSRIDQLLAKVVTGLAVIDGNLIVTHRDGTTLDAGGVGNSQSVMRLFYESGAYPDRPINVQCIEWVGPSLPPAMTSKDNWIDNS
jgi:hypothetical protein